MSRRQVGIILLAVGVSACADAGHPDQGPSDLDAGVTQDFGFSDQGTNDAERKDLGVADVMSDVGLPDSGLEVDVGGSGTLLATAVTAGRESSCAVFRGVAWCWGSNPGGALGAGTPGVTASAPQRLIEEGWTELDRDGDHSCGLRAGVPWCMGANRDGALGLGDQGDRHRPTMLAGTAWTRISAGAFHTCGIRAGSLYCWGLDGRGQAGHGASSAGPVLSPAQVGTENDWSEVSAGATFTCGIRAGSVYCFGDNSEGQLGRGHSRNEVENLVPMPISGVNYHGLSCGARHACSLNVTALYCWGDHLGGQLWMGVYPS